MTDFDLQVVPRRQGVRADGTTELDVLVRLRAPDAPTGDGHERSQRLSLGFVIDRSGSMNGRPLEQAKRCMLEMVESLRGDDRAALVVYDHDVALLRSAEPVADGDTLRALVAGISSRGMTNLHGGWLRGAGALADTLAANQLARVVLLSDGMANQGVTDPETITGQCAELAGAGVTTSTYGLGDAFNEDLMVAMARSGRGGHYYGRTADDLIGPFRQEFSLLENLCARNVRLTVRGLPDVDVEMLNDYSTAGNRGWLLPDLAYGGEAWAVVRLLVAPSACQRIGGDGILSLIDVSASMVRMDGSRVALAGSTLRLPAVGPVEWARLGEDAAVVRRAQELEAARYQRRIAEVARRRDWNQVEALLTEAEICADGNPWVREVLASLRNIAQQHDHVALSKEAVYSSACMSSRLADAHDTEEDLCADVESLKQPYLRRKREQGRREFRDER